MPATIVLNGVTLNPNMIWRERFVSQAVTQNVKRTLGGKMVVYSGGYIAGDSITLLAATDQGWLQKSVVDQLLVMAAVAGATYVLSFNGVDMNVIFRHNEPPAVEFSPFVPRVAHDTTDYMVGSIKLLLI